MDHLKLVLPRLTIVMPTLNSGRTIELSLQSIRSQEYPQELIEILVIDGGSIDQTLAIASRWGARIIPNPLVQQEYAKHIGLMIGTGKYAVFLDSDEVFDNALAIRRRVATFNEFPDTRVVLSGGYKKPFGASSVNDYINIFSDPFAWFMTRTNSETSSKITSWNKKYTPLENSPENALYDFSNNRKLPIVDFCGGHSLDLTWLRSELKYELLTADIVPRLFYLITKKANRVSVLKSDSIIHFSSDSYFGFVKKLRWRVVANTHFSELPGVGFKNREEFQSRYQRLKKYVFVLYAISLIFPIGDSLLQFYRTKKVGSLAHCPLTLITLGLLVFNYMLKVFGVRPAITIYGKS